MDKHDNIRIGIIGTAQIATHHLENYAKIDGAEVVAACDIDTTALDTASDRFEIPNRYTDFRELLQRDDLDAIDVCLHNNLHAPVSIAALESGKDVYCEKPIAGTYVDGKAMVDAAAACGRKLSIQLALLFNRETKAAKCLIDDGHLGKIYHARSAGFRRRGRPYVDGYGSADFVKMSVAGGGALFDMGVYNISRMLYLIGQPKLERVSGRLYQETPIDPGRLESSGYNVEELGLGLVHFEGGVTMDIIESWAIHLDTLGSSSVAGSLGGVRLDPFSFHTTLSDMDMDATCDLDAVEFRRHSLRDTEDAYDSPQHHWIAALQGRVPLLPTAEIALLTMQISEGIRLSNELNREIGAEEIESMSKSTALVL
jgi:predicted dehydrogenase